VTSSPNFRFWQALARKLRAGQRVFLALVVEHTRHSPGTTGARLFLSADGEHCGTLGGGVMEHDVLEHAARALTERDSPAELQALVHRKTGPGERSGMICAGQQTNLYSLCRPDEELPAIERLVKILEDGAAGTLRISPQGLDVAMEAPALDRPPNRLEHRSENGWLYEEELLNRRRLAILGGGHCALALARLMTRLGYHVEAFEAGKKTPEVALEQHVRRLEVVDDFLHAGDLIDYPELTSAVVMTSDLPSDVNALAGALRHPFPFLGVMGSPAKLAEIRKQLRDKGLPAVDLDRLTAPVGLPIGSRTPEEIAVSVAAQILQLRGAAR